MKMDTFYSVLVLDYIKKNIKTIVLYIIIVLFTFPTESVILPQLYGKLFSSLDKNNLMKGGGNLFSKLKDSLSNLNKDTIKKTIYLIIFVWVLVLIFSAIKHHMETKIIPSYLSYIRKTIFTKTITNHLNNYKELKLGKYISRVLEVSRQMRDCLLFSCDKIIPLVIAMIIVNIYFFFLNKKIFFISFAGLVISFLLLFFLGKKTMKLSAEREKYYFEMSEKIHDSLGNLMNVYLNNEHENEVKRNTDVEKKHTEMYKNQLKITNTMVAVLSVVSFIVFALIILHALKTLKEKKITTAQFISVLIILIYYLDYLMLIAYESPHFLSKLGNIQHSKKSLETILQDKTFSQNALNIEKGEIKFSNVSFKYPKDESYLFNNFNLNIKPKKITAITGSSGSGKTSLMKLLLSMHPIESGKITIDDIDISQANPILLRDQINYINQKTTLYNKSIIDNIKFGNDNLTDKQILDIMEKYKLGTVYQELENGINTDAGVHGSNLSLGMQKMTILLRGIFKQGKIFAFDEPLAGLDQETRKKVIKLIMEICKNKTVLIITHDKEIIPYCDEVMNITDIKKNKLNS